MVDGPVCRHVIGHQQLMTPWCARQLRAHGDGDLLVDGNRPHLATLALDGDGALPERPLRRGGVDTETLMDTETCIPG